MSDKKWWLGYFDEAYRRVYAPLLTEERTKNEVEGIIQLAKIHPGANILDAGCGDGRHAISLAKRGYKVTCVDVSESMLQEARNKANEESVDSIRFLHADIRNFELESNFDLVISMFTSLGYTCDPAEEEKIIVRLAGAVAPEGKLLLDLKNPSWFEAPIFSRGGFKRGDQEHSYDRETRIWTIRHEIEGRKREACIYIFSKEEISNLLKKVGFNQVRFFGNMSGENLSKDSSRMLVLAAKTSTTLR